VQDDEKGSEQLHPQHPPQLRLWWPPWVLQLLLPYLYSVVASTIEAAITFSLII